jgi:putative ABC transport system permease protein
MKKNFYYKMNLRRIWGLSKKIFLSNLYRNVVVIIAVVLSTFMLTSVFSVGFSYIETAQLQQIRAMGTTAHVAINNPSDLQVSEIKKSDSIKDIGISQHLGQIDGLEDEDLLLGLNWIDENEWNLHRMPTISDVVGNYPVTENEVMIPTWILERLGITNPQEGMSISLSYHLDDDDSIKTQEFILAGYYTDYSS